MAADPPSDSGPAALAAKNDGGNFSRRVHDRSHAAPRGTSVATGNTVVLAATRALLSVESRAGVRIFSHRYLSPLHSCRFAGGGPRSRCPRQKAAVTFS